MKLIDLTGKVFGRLAVMKRSQNRIAKGGQSKVVWECLCSCGNTKQIHSARLIGRGKQTQSCGCIQKEIASANAVLRSTKHGLEGTTALNMWRSAKSRAAKQSVPFLICHSDIVIPEICPLLGIKLIAGSGKFSDCSPSLDKIIPALGYVPGNVWVISMRANCIKRDASLEELQLLSHNLKVKLKGE